MSAQTTAGKTGSQMPEFLRKIVVSLKRKPQTIPLLALIAAFLVYSLNLSHISDTTAKIQGPGMGLCGFATMLFSMLSLMCFLNAFPHRKKVHIPMLLLMFVMFGIILYCDMYYSQCIMNALTRAENPIELSETTLYIAYAYNDLIDHQRVFYVAIALIVLLPVYSRLIKKIDTSVIVEDNGGLGEIDISGED